MTEYINIAPTWHAALCHIVPAALAGHDGREAREAAIEVLEDAANKLDMLSRFIDSDDRVLRMFQDFQQQEAAR
jgi:hypothetical protein